MCLCLTNQQLITIYANTIITDSFKVSDWTCNGNIYVQGLVDGVDVSKLINDFDNLNIGFENVVDKNINQIISGIKTFTNDILISEEKKLMVLILLF